MSMGKTINPARVRELAEWRGIRSAKQLASKLGVSVRTAYRIWAGDIAPRSRAVELEKLAEVLGVDVAVLTGEAPMPVAQSDDKPEEDVALHHTTLKTVIGAGVANALALNVLRYGVPIKTQVELAALLFHVVAQRSLRHRREALKAIDQAHEHLHALSRERTPHLPSLGRLSIAVDDAMYAEERSIEAEDILAASDEVCSVQNGDIHYEDRNPFAEEIRRLAAGLPDIDEERFETTSYGVGYTINRPQAMTLADGDEELAEAILAGTIKLQGLGKLVRADRTQERVAELRRRWDEYRAEYERRFGVSPELEPF
jgi:transcriptional regulator with XRE-family HTH domain